MTPPHLSRQSDPLETVRDVLSGYAAGDATEALKSIDGLNLPQEGLTLALTLSIALSLRDLAFEVEELRRAVQRLG